MLQTFKNGQGSIVLRVKLLNSSVATGAGLTGLTSASAGLIISTIADNEASATTYTVAGSTIETITTLGTYAAPTATKCRFKEVDATNHKGVYEIQIADARFAVSSAKSLLVSLSGATNLAEADFVIQLQSLDPFDAVRAGLTAFPNVASGSAGALLVDGTGTAAISNSSGKVLLQAGTGAGQLDFTSGVVKANAVQLLGTAWLTPGTAGTPDVNAKLIGGTAQTGLDIGANWTAARAAHLDADISSRMATFTLPTNFSALAITVGGVVSASGNWSIAGDAMSLTGGERTTLAGVINTTAIVESYRANGAAPTPAQFMSEVLAHLGESSIASTTKTLKKLDHATTAETYTLDSATTPASITRAS